MDSKPLRSRIPVKVGRSVSGELLPPLVSRLRVYMVQKLKAALPSSTDDLAASGQVGGSSQPSHAFAVPLPPRVISRSSDSGMALRTSSRSRSPSGDERPPLSPEPHRSRRRASSGLGAVNFAVVSPPFSFSSWLFHTFFALLWLPQLFLLTLMV